MYVCICNALTDRDVASAIQLGANSVSRVYQKHGCKAQCGKCSCQVRDMLKSRITSQPAPLAQH